jgi:hypothetical protein
VSGRGEGKTAYPQVQAACLIELGTHAVFDARLDEYAAAETMLIEEMFSALQPGMLVLADRHVYSFHRWRRATATGADLLWRVPSNLTLRPVKHLPDGSYIAEVIPPAKSGMVSFRVRVIEYKLTDVQDGKDELYRLVTTILDPEQAPAKELAVLCHERWDIEGFSSRSRVFSSTRPGSSGPNRPTGCGRSFGHTWRCATRQRASSWTPPITPTWIPTAYPTRTPSASSGPESGFRTLSPSAATMITIGASSRRSPARSTRHDATAAIPG